MKRETTKEAYQRGMIDGLVNARRSLQIVDGQEHMIGCLWCIDKEIGLQIDIAIRTLKRERTKK